MLAALSIRDIVLIDRLDLEFGPGLAVLSGETGAGKSIVLDALALALGARGEARLVRHGVEQGSVTAAFSGWQRTPVAALLEEQGLAASTDDDLVLRRIQYRDGRTRAFVNGEPVNVGLARDLGHALVEIHGQHDERALLEPAMHLALVDAYGGLEALANDVAGCWERWREAAQDVETHEAEMARSAADAEFLRHSHEELTKLAPEAGEEDRLAGERALMMAGEKIAEELARADMALFGEGGAEEQIGDALAALESGNERAPGQLVGAVEAVTRARAELDEVRRELAEADRRAQSDPARLEEVEERLFALRAAARKHDATVDELPKLASSIEARLQSLESGEERLKVLVKERDEARARYLERAGELGRKRCEAASRLDETVMAELEPLRLGEARFETAFEALNEESAGPRGLERAQFMIATIAGAPPGPLRRVASGGELSRVMLALKVALTGAGGAPTLIFDEIDSGVGGAVADAVGERLQKLGSELQVLVVTHSPQVAARANDHLLIEKSGVEGAEAAQRTQVSRLDEPARREEIARMLAGASVTDEARAAAGRLIGGAGG